jgi:hypothetical protein
MKKLLLIALPLLLVMGCKDKEEKIPFTEVELSTLRFLENHQKEGLIPCDTLIFVNTIEELKNIVCDSIIYHNDIVWYPPELPHIDFSNQTLIIAAGVTSSGSEVSEIFLYKFQGKYILNIKIMMYMAAVAKPWQVCVLTQKILDSEQVSSKIKNIDQQKL